MNTLKYKDFIGSVAFSEADGVFFGKIEGIDGLVNFEGESVAELTNAFHEAVDDYLAYCAEEGIEPHKSYSGSLNVRLTPDIHTRKERMAAMADAVVALPGGCGTLEELLEIITWKQLGLYKGKIVIVNTEGFFTPLLQMLQRCVDEGFMKQSHKTLWTVAETPEKASSEALAADKSIVEPKR